MSSSSWQLVWWLDRRRLQIHLLTDKGAAAGVCPLCIVQSFEPCRVGIICTAVHRVLLARMCS
jgi:hypothetical protein